MQEMSIAVFHILCCILFLVTPSSFNLSCRSIVLNIDLDDLGFMNKGPSDEVIHTQREGSVGMAAKSIEYRCEGL